MSEEIEFPSGEEEIEETVAADAAEDTLAADAGDDTAEADGGEDTVQADSAASPFEEFGEPAAKDKPAATIADEPDDIDKELSTVEAALEADPTDPEALKKYVGLNKKARQRDAAVSKRAAAQAAQAAEDAEYRRLETSSGLADAPAEVRKKLTKKVIYERFDKHMKAELADGATAEAARGAAKSTIKHEIKAIIAAAGKKTKPLARVQRTEAGATLTPPGGGGRAAKEKPKDEDVFINGDWEYPSSAGLQ